LEHFLDRPLLFGLDGAQVLVWPVVLALFGLALLIGARDPHGRPRQDREPR
jgi:hypothetical protein